MDSADGAAGGPGRRDGLGGAFPLQETLSELSERRSEPERLAEPGAEHGDDAKLQGLRRQAPDTRHFGAVCPERPWFPSTDLAVGSRSYADLMRFEPLKMENTEKKCEKECFDAVFWVSRDRSAIFSAAECGPPGASGQK